MDRKGSDESEGAQHRSMAAAKGPRLLPQHSDLADAAHAELFGSGGHHRAFGRAAKAGLSSEAGEHSCSSESICVLHAMQGMEGLNVLLPNILLIGVSSQVTD